jgi:hypothetical protein
VNLDEDDGVVVVVFAVGVVEGLGSKDTTESSVSTDKGNEEETRFGDMVVICASIQQVQSKKRILRV